MANRLQKQPVLIYVQDVKTVPGRAAYCTTKTHVIKQKDSQKNPTFNPMLDGILPAGSYPIYGPCPPDASGANGSSGYSSSDCIIGYANAQSSPPGYQGNGDRLIREDITTCYPSIPPVYNFSLRVDKSANNGWNGGARSIKPVPDSGYFKVFVPGSSIAVMVGIGTGQYDYSYAHMSHALVARPSGVTPVEYGQEVGPEVPFSTDLKIERTATGVSLFVGGSEVHRSLNMPVGTSYGYASLYAVSDFVDYPLVGAIHHVSGVSELEITTELMLIPGGVSSFRIMTDAAALLDGVALASAVTSFSMETQGEYTVEHLGSGASELTFVSSVGAAGAFSRAGVTSFGMAYAAGVLALVGTASEIGVAKASGVFSRAVLDGRISRPEAEYTSAEAVFPLPIGSGGILNGSVSSGSGYQLAVGKASAGSYFGGIAPPATVYALSAWEPYLGDNELDGTEIMLSVDRFALDTALMFALHEGLSIGDDLDIYLVINLEAYEYLGITPDMSFASTLELLINERLSLSDTTGMMRKEALQYAVNAVTGSLSTYQNFGFKQFAFVGGRTYAYNEAGLYEVGCGTDHGKLISASIDFGASDYGTAQSKRISSVYAGIATDGGVYIRVAGDGGEERVYKAVDYGSEARAVTAKGLSSRHWRVRLELQDASYADLDNIEVNIGTSQRRLRGCR